MVLSRFVAVNPASTSRARSFSTWRCGNDEIQCGECGGEYEQPTLYPFLNCPHCGAPFAAQDELLVELPILVKVSLRRELASRTFHASFVFFWSISH